MSQRNPAPASGRRALPRRSVLAAALLLLALPLANTALGQTAAPPGAAPAPDASPTPAASPKPHRPAARVRFWNMLPRTFAGGVPLELFNGPVTPSSKPVFSTASMNTSAGYLTVPPGSYNFHVCRADDRDHPIRVAAVSLRDGTFVTFATSLGPGGQPQTEVLDDTIDPEKGRGGVLTVRQFLPGARVVVQAGPAARTPPLIYGEKHVFADLPPASVPITLQATLRPGESPRVWATEANFTPAPGNSPHATLLVVGDAYGRMRAYVVDDGLEPAPESPPAPRGPPRSTR